VVNSANHAFTLLMAATCVLLMSCSIAQARDVTPDMGLGQYAHRTWTFGEGVVDTPIHAIAQTPDGYLWLGTQVGLWRFDGVRAVPWRAPGGRHLSGKWIQSLLATQDGTLWIGTDAGLDSWRDGKLVEYSALDGLDVLALLADREGTVWAATESRSTSTGRLCAIRDGAVRCYGQDGSLGARIYCLYEDGSGHLWFMSSSGVWRWSSGKPMFYPMRDSITGYFQSLTSAPGGGILVSGHDELEEIVDGEVRAFPLPAALPQGPPPWVLTDRDGALWLGTMGNGLRYVRAGHMDFLEKSDGLSGDQIMRMFEDREGNVWVVTKSGLDEFWKIAAARFPGESSLSNGSVTSVLADVDGSIWFAMQTGLYRRKDGEMTVYRGHEHKSERPAAREIIVKGLPIDTSGPLYQDHRGRIWLGSPAGLGYLQNDRFVAVPRVPAGELTCISEDDQGNLWVAHRKLGLFRISPEGDVQRFSWGDLGIAETWSIVFDPSRHGLWLGSILGEIAFFRDGKILESYAINSPGKRGVRDLRLDADNTLWAATEAGLVRLSNGHLAILNSESGLPCDIVHATIDDDAGSTWIYTACGLVRVERSDLKAWGRGTLGRQVIPNRVLDASDGVRSSDVWHFSPKIAKSSDGRLWLASATGPMVVDPRILPRNALPPPVHIEQIVADRKIYDTSSPVRLLPLVRDLEIDYTALSLVAPEKNQFRYKLEGVDPDWRDAGHRRQAFYNDLAPGDYRFRVIASNNSDIWNSQGATLAFSIAPVYWQTGWFRALCALTLIALLWFLYLLRVRQLARQFNITLEARVNERTRIARELHDTLLQSFQGLLLRFQTVVELWPTDKSKELLANTIEQVAEAITEGRSAVEGLRTSTTETNDLANAIRRLGEELANEATDNDVILRIEVHGASRPLHPLLRDEVFRITSEAVRNAFRHSGAKQIDVEFHYDKRYLQLRVCDRGRGIAPDILSQGGREMHYGMRSMRERTRIIGGELTVRSSLNAGTEVELTVPASRAYTPSHSTWRSRIVGWLR